MGRAAWWAFVLAVGCGTDTEGALDPVDGGTLVSAQRSSVAPGHGAAPDVSEGAAIYRDVCSTCHEIGDASSKNFVVEAACCTVAAFEVATTEEDDNPDNVRPVSFKDPGYWAHEPTDDYLAEVIRKGGAPMGLSPLMPAMGPQYDDAQVASVIRYIRSLRPG